ncbi:MAG: hypothetical protein WA988_19805, partial [Candidatus Nanopelagicales bacterium]
VAAARRRGPTCTSGAAEWKLAAGRQGPHKTQGAGTARLELNPPADGPAAHPVGSAQAYIESISS